VIGSRVRWVRSPQGWVRHVCLDAYQGPSRGTVVVVPGLGLPRYTVPLSRELRLRGWDVVTVDALAARPRWRAVRVAPTIGGIAGATSHWLASAELRPPVVVLGHSTGAQVALEVVLAVQGTRPEVALVMAGPTFTPAQRQLRRLIPAALTAYRKDTPKELVVLRDLARVRTDVVRVVLSGLRHHPEDRMPALRVPVTLTAGEADSFAPAPWLHELAEAAGGPSHAEVLPGSHNNVFLHAGKVAELLRTVRAS
jgi:surfactin synthase thioesterase subunit